MGLPRRGSMGRSESVYTLYAMEFDLIRSAKFRLRILVKLILSMGSLGIRQSVMTLSLLEDWKYRQGLLFLMTFSRLGNCLRLSLGWIRRGEFLASSICCCTLYLTISCFLASLMTFASLGAFYVLCRIVFLQVGSAREGRLVGKTSCVLRLMRSVTSTVFRRSSNFFDILFTLQTLDLKFSSNRNAGFLSQLVSVGLRIVLIAILRQINLAFILRQLICFIKSSRFLPMNTDEEEQNLFFPITKTVNINPGLSSYHPQSKRLKNAQRRSSKPLFLGSIPLLGKDDALTVIIQNDMIWLYNIGLTVKPYIISKNMSNFEWISIEPTPPCVRPGARWGHSCCVVDQDLYLFGGFANSNYMNDIWVYHLKTMSWKEVTTTGDVPDHRSNATLNYDAVNHQLILFGGGGPNKQRFNSISVLDLKSLSWVEFQPFENEPSPLERTYHIAEFKFPYLVVFGGEGVDDLGDLWVYNLETLSWREVRFSNQAARPKARRFHSSCLVENSVYVFGGCEGKYSCLGDLFELDLSAFLESGNTNDLAWNQVKLDEEIVARWGQTSHYYNGQIYIFGGRAGDDLQDLFTINPNTGKVTQITANLQPKPRRRHSGGFIGSCLVLFGGFDGNYFNDHFYINLYKNKSPQLETSYARRRECIDHDISTDKKVRFGINTSPITKYFQTEEDLVDFLSDIDQVYPEEVLTVIFETLEKGYGPLPLEKAHKNYLAYKPSPEQEAGSHIINKILKIPHLNSIGLKQEQRKAVELESFQLITYLKSIKRHWQYTDYLKLNNSDVLRISKGLLASESEFFRILFNSAFKSQEMTSIELKGIKVIHLELIFAFLNTKVLVVPKYSIHHFFIEIAQLAEYFCIPSLLRACEEELTLRIEFQNCRELSEVSRHFNFEHLSEHCSLFTLNKLPIDQGKSKPHIFSERQQQKLDEKTLKLYKLIQFDLAHQKPHPKSCKLPFKTSQHHDTSTKQNLPFNGLPRKTSSSFQK